MSMSSQILYESDLEQGQVVLFLNDVIDNTFFKCRYVLI